MNAATRCIILLACAAICTSNSRKCAHFSWIWNAVFRLLLSWLLTIKNLSLCVSCMASNEVNSPCPRSIYPVVFILSAILNCRCVKNSDAVSRHLIARIKQLPPRWYCNREELMWVSAGDSVHSCFPRQCAFYLKAFSFSFSAVLKDGREKCLAPNGRFAQAIKRYRT